ncbi:hypothetical protein Tco_0069133, partial [Tanacetum coccineum]
MEPLDALLMGDEVISTTLARENTEFIKSSVDDLIPIPRESEVTSVYIDLPFGEQIETLSMGDRKIDFNPLKDVEILKVMFEKPLGNLDMMSRSVETSDFILEEISTGIGLNDSISTKIDDGYYDSEGDILYLEQLLNEDIISDLSPALL